MKIRLYNSILISLILGFTSCNEKVETYMPEFDRVGPSGHWLSINIVNPGVPGSRDDDHIYEYGKENEHAVSSVSFYFFDASGKIVILEDGSDRVVLQNPEVKEENANNIEAVLSHTFELDSQITPQYVVAVLNPPSQLETKKVERIVDLREITEDYSDTSEIGFVMTNSVYKDNEGREIYATKINSENWQTSATEASRHPVAIFVERVVAKVSLEVDPSLQCVSLPDGSEAYKTESIDANNNPIYVKLLGWNVSASSNKSFLIKKINPDWNEDLFSSGEKWNLPGNFRSFWAINPADVGYIYGSLLSETAEHPEMAADYIKYFQDSDDEAKANYTYLNENAAKNSAGENPDVTTKMIMAAMLVDADGNPLDYAEYGGGKFTKEGLLSYIASQLPYYKEIGDANPATFQQISKDDLQFTVNNNPEIPSYVINVALRDESVEWYIDPEGQKQIVSVSEINTILNQMCVKNRAKVWENGLTYYSADIIHSKGEGIGEFGIVRNNFYQMTVVALNGIGTPVFNPDKIIIPEVTEETFLTVEVKVMDWRLLKQSFDIAW